MKVGSLFSGIGGLDLGLERAGMEIIWQVEIDPFCQKVLKKHWPGVPCYGDIKEIDFTTLPRPDLICGGFPCQPVSCAGKRQGDKDERWLWPNMFRSICKIRPRFAIMENVAGLFNRGFGQVIGDLANAGYDSQWSLISAAQFGAPHLRFRIFIISYPSGERLSYLFEQLPQFEKSTVNSRTWNGRRLAQSDIIRVVDGIPRQLDRLKALGNAVVPQVAEWIGRRILEVTTQSTTDHPEVERLRGLEPRTIGLEVGSAKPGDADE